MSEDERKLMISLAKALKIQGDILLGKKEGEATQIPIHPIASPLFPAPTSSIQHEHKNRNANINVQFAGELNFTEKQRLDESIHFIRELEELLQAYSIIHLDGTYDRISTGTV